MSRLGFEQHRKYREAALIPGMWNVGLKEWAATVDAIGRGEQIFLLRKGGIREDGRHFKIEHDQFFLYPGHYHEGVSLLKPEKRSLLEDSDPTDFRDVVELSVFAELVETIKIAAEAEVRALHPFHIWSEDFAVKRFSWKPRHPLNLMIVRAHKLQQPQALLVMEQYAGCKSWVEFVEDYPVGVTSLALSDRRFDAQVKKIKDALEEARSAVS